MDRTSIERAATAGIVGRTQELAAIALLLDGLDDGPAVLSLGGEAGIGKTTVWEAGVAAARDRGYAVLVSRPAAAEVRLSYAGLADLLVEVEPAQLARLPRPQARALDAALLRALDHNRGPDPRAVAAGFLSVLAELAATVPVLVAIDDIQWLDEPTRSVVAFAVRRCSGPVATLIASRSDQQSGTSGTSIELLPLDPAGLRRVHIGPLSLGALHEVIAQRARRSLPRPAMVRIAQLSGGNPFFALELARSLGDGAPGTTPLPDSLRALVHDRISALAPEVQETLLLVSALGEPRVEAVARALDAADVNQLLGVAQDHGVVEIAGGRVRFSHPVLAEGVRAESPPSQRRAVHKRLSEVVDDPEERARHLALAAVGPDGATVKALDAAAAQARQRGAPAAAAELLQLAIGLGADEPSRLLEAAHDYHHANDPMSAQELLERASSQIGPGPRRAELLALLGTIRYQVDAHAAAAEVLQEALGEAGDAGQRAAIAQELAYALVNGGRIAEALQYATMALGHAEEAGDDGLLAEALGAWSSIRYLNGQGLDEAALKRARALEDPDRRSHAAMWPTLTAALAYLWAYRLDEARDALAEVRQRCIERGEDSNLSFVSYFAAVAACQCGDIDNAERLALEVAERSSLLGTDLARAGALLLAAHVSAWVGRAEEARTASEQAMAIYGASGNLAWALLAMSSLGMLELSMGEHEAAALRLGPLAAATTAMDLTIPAVAPFLPDAIEALVVQGRVDEAAPLVDRLEEMGRRPDNGWAAALGARGRGLLLAAQGRLDEARAALEQALAAQAHLPLVRYDRGRTLLALGQLQRRRNQRRAAKAALEEAAALFDDVGAGRWATNARTELERLGLRPGPSDELTPTEARVAQLAASGLTNREMAAALFISPKTVEANLSRVYRKLGIHSRAELGRHMAEAGAEARGEAGRGGAGSQT